VERDSVKSQGYVVRHRLHYSAGSFSLQKLHHVVSEPPITLHDCRDSICPQLPRLSELDDWILDFHFVVSWPDEPALEVLCLPDLHAGLPLLVRDSRVMLPLNITPLESHAAKSALCELCKKHFEISRRTTSDWLNVITAVAIVRLGVIHLPESGTLKKSCRLAAHFRPNADPLRCHLIEFHFVLCRLEFCPA
jgi:hypothetical protein